MPRSRSWSIESMTRSVSVSWAAKTPDWRSMASTRVVLPWSTWAMIATLRRSERAGMGLLGWQAIGQARVEPGGLEPLLPGVEEAVADHDPTLHGHQLR